MRYKILMALLAACLALTCRAGSPAKRKVIIDQDAFGPGGSNLQSILMLVQAPDVDVLGIAVESGDGWQKESVAHTLRMLELIGRPDIPVLQGATYPLINTQEETKRWEAIYGKLPYKGAWMESWPSYNTINRPHYHAADVVPPLEEGEPTIKAASEPAALFIVHKLREFPGEVSVVAMGPFTNLAIARGIDEGALPLAKELVIMGASLNPDASHLDEFSLQFVNNPRVEFNFRWDPEAAKIMLQAGWRKITVVPTDATVDTKFSADVLRRATDGADTPCARYVSKYGQVGFPMWDEVASAVFLDPSIAKESTRLALDVVIDHGAAYGATQSWAAGKGPGLGEPDVTVIRRVDVARLEGMFADCVRRPPQKP
jgi:purine nucleosidase